MYQSRSDIRLNLKKLRNGPTIPCAVILIFRVWIDDENYVNMLVP